MELIDTIDDMKSDDFIKRLEAEYNQINIRIEKLDTFLYSLVCGCSKITPKTPVELLKMQLEHMKQYRDCLKIRLVVERDLCEVK